MFLKKNGEKKTAEYRLIFNNINQCSSRELQNSPIKSRKFTQEYSSFLDLSIIAYNARSLKNQINNQALLNYIHNEKPDVILICESWLKNDIRLFHSGYKQFRSSDYDGSPIIVNSSKYNSMKIAVPSEISQLLTYVLLLCNCSEIYVLICYYSKPGTGKKLEIINWRITFHG